MLQQAFSLHQEGRLAEAAAIYKEILARDPHCADALHLLGVIELQLKNPFAAKELIDKAIDVNPENAAYYANRGIALQDLKRFDEALTSYDRALRIQPDYAEALNNRGLALGELKRFDDALVSYDRALAIKPDFAEVLYNRGVALQGLRRFDDALASYDRALSIKPDYPDALLNRGNMLVELRRLNDALVSYASVLAIKPDFVGALVNLGSALADLKRFDDALAALDRALAIRPDCADALVNRGSVLDHLKQFDDALSSFDQALAVKPDYPFLFGMRLHDKMRICDWRGLAVDFRRLSEKIAAGESASPPFPVLATPVSGAQQRANSELYVRERYPQVPLLPKLKDRYEHHRICLGYFSADFCNHATAYLIAEMIERHDRSKFELTAFSFGPPTTDAMRMRLEKSFDRFVDVSALSDKDVALRARALEIDIAVDLNGFAQDNRTGIFALRAAPVQVNYLGYPGTMGADYFDYLIADSTLIPKEHQQDYAEKIAYLPHTYQANDSRRSVAETQFTRAECGLPEIGFVFCCFNNNWKIIPGIFDIWMRLLKRVDGSVLWLLEDNVRAAKNLRSEARARGIAPTRLVFANRIDVSEHLARHSLADLFLDTLPCNAHTTASDALWVGLPVLTCLGEAFPGRVAASVLKAVGLTELIANNLAEYETLALDFATDPQKLHSVREKLATNRLTHPLFDTARFTRHIESAYTSMWERHQAGFAPEHIYVRPDIDPV